MTPASASSNETPAISAPQPAPRIGVRLEVRFGAPGVATTLGTSSVPPLRVVASPLDATVPLDEALRDVADHAHQDQVVLALDDAEEVQVDARVVDAAAAVESAPAEHVLTREHRFDSGGGRCGFRQIAQAGQVRAVGVLLQR